MSYDAAKHKAWDELSELKPAGKEEVKLLGEGFAVDLKNKSVVSLLTSSPAKDFSAILILHYLARRLKGLPQLNNEWLTFRELSGVEGYAEAFRRRAIEPIVKKYGLNPQGICADLNKFPAKKIEGADVGIIVEAFPNVPVLIKVWMLDAEFEADANIYFDRSILKIFCTEDIVVLAGIIASKL
ncbi:MAG: DUF3786 domain-containing protein [Candidatus Omnitrophota bacterium]|jgi:hypothetical protein